MQALLSPYIIGTMGYRSRRDAKCWRLFTMAVAGFVAIFAGQAAEPRLCGLPGAVPGAVIWHAVGIHLLLVVVFGCVAFLALRLLEVEGRKKV